MAEQPAPLVRGYFGDRRRVIRGMLPAWEVYALTGMALTLNAIVVQVFVDAYVLCPGREDARVTFGPEGDGTYYKQVRDFPICDFPNGYGVAVGTFVLFALCAYGTSAPYARWKLQGLAKPTYPLTVAQEHPELLENIQTLRELLERTRRERNEFLADVDAQIKLQTNIASWPALLSFDARPLGVVWWGFTLPVVLALPGWLLYSFIAFVSYDLSRTWGPDRFNYTAPALDEFEKIDVVQPADDRDERFATYILFDTLMIAILVGWATALIGSASMLRKGYYVRPNEMGKTWCDGLFGISFYDPTPLLEGGQPLRRSGMRNTQPLWKIRNQAYDGNP